MFRSRSHGVREVSSAVFESCDLEANYIKQWSPNVRQAKVIISLQKGKSYYFIDSVVGGCRSGRRLSVRTAIPILLIILTKTGSSWQCSCH